MDEITVYSDSDWAGERESGRSTSGGVIMIGEHWIKSWARTQQCVTLSTAEAELVAMVKASTECIGVKAMMADLGKSVQIAVMIDSPAAMAIAARRGCGKMRHVAVGQLWVQERVETKDIMPVKVRGDNNPADLLTKNVKGVLLDRYIKDMGMRVEAGHNAEGLQLQ